MNQSAIASSVFRADVCVVGGGPAGSTIAARLAAFGYDVIVIEACVFPRAHVGICLSDETAPLLSELGVLDDVRRADFHKRRVTWVQWSRPEGDAVPNPGLHLDRGRFDQILLSNARERGVTLLQPAKLVSAIRAPHGWTLAVATPRETCSLECRFLVEATGRHSIVDRVRRRQGAPLFAIHAEWQLNHTPEYDGWIEALDHSWCWFAQTTSNAGLLSLFIDPRSLRGSRHSVQTLYGDLVVSSELSRTAILSHCTSAARGCDASAGYLVEPVGADFIRIGDASMTVDPLASQGVHLAMASALTGAVVANTILRWPSDREHAIAFFRDQQQERIRRFRNETAKTYREVAAWRAHSFWQDRAGDTTDEPQPPTQMGRPTAEARLALSPLAEIRLTPMLEEQRIRTGPALHHPGLQRPAAYVGGAHILCLIAELPRTVTDLVPLWARHMPVEVARQAVEHLWQAGVVVAAP